MKIVAANMPQVQLLSFSITNSMNKYRKTCSRNNQSKTHKLIELYKICKYEQFQLKPSSLCYFILVKCFNEDKINNICYKNLSTGNMLFYQIRFSGKFQIYSCEDLVAGNYRI